MELSLLALVLGFIMDLLWGDPKWMYHPICLIGNLISFLEKRLNDRKEEKRDERHNFRMGIVMAVLVVTISAGVPLLILMIAQMIHPVVRLVLETIMCWQILAMKSLREAGMQVYEALSQGTIEESRHAVSMIVGRDTESLDEAGVTKATVETIAENTSDGVIAPMFYMMIGGAVLGFFYKAINTMDSMVGYKNDRYLYFGRFAAKMDDVVNFIPARLSAIFMIAGAYVLKLDWKHAWEIFKRDRRKHASPNSAQTESVVAGALNVQLAGDAWYFGTLHKKETIGDNIRPIKSTDIIRTGRMMYAASAIALAVFAVLKGIVILLCL